MIITISYLGVLVAAIASFAFGSLWHSPLGFANYWRTLIGAKEGEMHKMQLAPVQSMLLGFIATVLFAYVLAHFIAVAGIALGGVSIGSALEVGFWVWLGFVVVTLSGGFLWEGKSLQLFAFNVAYQFISIMIMSFVLGIIH